MMGREFDRMERQGNRMMLAVLLAISVPLLLLAAFMAWRSVSYLWFADVTQGKVVEIKGDAPSLVIEFVANGKVRQFESAGSDLNRGWQVGDTLRVFYRQDRPADVRPDLFVDMWILPIVCGVFGGFFFLPVIFLFGSDLVNLVMPRSLDKVGRVVQAEYVGHRFALDIDRVKKMRDIGSISLNTEGSRTVLLHNGQPKDPEDGAVRQALGIRFVAQFRWQDPSSGKRYQFESDMLDQDPDRAFKGRTTPVRFDPERPENYRVESPLTTMNQKRTSAIE